MLRKKVIITISLLICLTLAATGCSKKPKHFENKESSTTQSAAPSSSMPQSSAPSSAPSSSATSSEPAEIPAAVFINGSEYDMTKLDALENEGRGWGQGKRVDDKNRPETCDPAQDKYGDFGGLFIMPDDEKKIYLTFDEGYEVGYTPQILDALKEKQAPAVFFVTMDYVKKHPDLVRRMIDEGHVVGNHSVRHLSMPSLTSAEAVEEIIGLHNYVVDNFDYQMTLFRPPMGEFSTRTMQIAQDLGYKTVLWSFAYLDYKVEAQMGVEAAFPAVTGAAHNGAIFLLHAVSKDNTEMLADVIDNFRAQGFELANLATDQTAEKTSTESTSSTANSNVNL